MTINTATTAPTAATRTWITDISDTCDFGLFNLPMGICSFVIIDDDNDNLRSEEKQQKVRTKTHWRYKT
jgi:hypothetical protein